MNYYGIFMSVGWLILSYDLENRNKNNEICIAPMQIISPLGALFCIVGSKIFQKIFRNTWEGNASFGAMYGFYIYFCLISIFCDIPKFMNTIAFTLPIVYMAIRIGNYCNGEHFNNEYYSIIEGLLQGPIIYLILLYNKSNIDPIILFVVWVSIIRIYSEFLRNKFDIKNIVISVIFMILIFFYKHLISFEIIPFLLFVLDLTSKNYLNNQNIVKNYGFNFSIARHYTRANKVVHLFLFLIFLPFILKSRLILLGALSNLFDRVVHGYIVDYIKIPYLNYCFNIADIMIFGGLFLMHLFNT
ncbi:hypothetical protein CPAV1605_1301 [seawater metagenome]|uniref:Signal peptidase II n=1 Tax=seawater metagenome TaxID=1561972 RepID=A0A5E8CL49_9ZZZZ